MAKDKWFSADNYHFEVLQMYGRCLNCGRLARTDFSGKKTLFGVRSCRRPECEAKIKAVINEMSIKNSSEAKK